MREELFDFAFAIGEVVTCLHVMELNVTFGPIKVGPFGMDRVVVQPHKAADLIEQPGGWGLTFHGVALVFWGSDSSKTISRTLDNGPGTFDLKLCSISYYQVKVQCQSMVGPNTLYDSPSDLVAGSNRRSVFLLCRCHQASVGAQESLAGCLAVS